MHNAHVAEVCRLLVLLVLLASASTKSLNIRQFSSSLADGFRVPTKLSMWVAFGVVASEWVAFFALLRGGSWGLAGAILALFLLLIFSAAMLEVIVSKRQATCNCLGRSTHQISTIDLVRNAVYILAASLYILLAPYDTADGSLAQLSLALTAVLCFLLSSSMHEIRSLWR